AASPTSIVTGNYLGYYQFGGYDGTQNIRAAWITGIATQNWSTTGRGAGIVFSTTPDNSTTMTERIRIDENGNMGIGTTTPRGKQDIWGGSLYVTGSDVNGTMVAGSQSGIAYLGCNTLTNGI